MIETRRLRLIPATLETLRTELDSPSELAAVMRMEVAEEWPPELYDRDPIEFTIRRLELAPEEAHWWLYYFALRGGAEGGEVVIGCGGFKGPPANGQVEIGYSIVPAFRRQGLATEAAAGLVRHAFGYPDVTTVIAETLPVLQPSISVLEKCGFHFIGEGSEDGVIRYALERAEWLAAGEPRGPARGGSMIAMHPIGTVRSPYTETAQVPKGPGAQHEAEGILDILPELEAGLTDIEGFSHLYVIWVFDRAQGCDLLSLPPSDDRPHGVFATRAPRRPNPIGLTVVQLQRRDRLRLHVRGLDMLDGTPILDIKPYLSSVPSDTIQRGWLADAEARGIPQFRAAPGSNADAP